MHQLLLIRAKLMYYRSLTKLERQGIMMDDYREACEVVRERIESDPKAFDSAPEVIACIQLIHSRVRTQLHRRIAGFTVDFALPEEQVVLEIDGIMHRQEKRLLEDWEKDRKVLAELGSGWEVVHIPAELVEQNVRPLMKAVRSLKKRQAKLRAENSGFLPDWYSARDRAKLKKLLGRDAQKHVREIMIREVRNERA